MFTITVTAEGQQPERYTFDQAEVSIGRVAGNDIVLKQNNISKRHSRLVVKNGNFILIDLKSTNGTLVNGRKITAPQVVTSADRFSIGDFSLQLDRDSVEGVEVAPAASAAEVPSSAPAGIERLEPRSRAERSSGSELFPMDAVPRTGRASAPAPAPPPKPAPVPARSTAATPPIPPPTGTARAVPARTERASSITEGHRSAGAAAFPDPQRRGFRPGQLAPSAELSRATDSLSLELPVGNELLTACVAEVVARWLDEGDDNLPPIRPLRSETIREHGTSALRLFETSGGAVPKGVDRDLLLQLVGVELTGLGPLEAYLTDDTIEEVHVNAFDCLTLRRGGLLEKAPMCFSSVRSWERVAGRLRDLGQFSDRTGGILRLAGGGRLDLVLPPVAACGPVLTVTKPQREVKSLDELVAEGVVHERAASILRAAVTSGAGLLLSSNALSDASTLFEALLKERPPGQRVVTVQESAGSTDPPGETVRLEQGPDVWPSAVARALGMGPTLLGIDPLSESLAGDWLLGSAARSCTSILTLPARSSREALTRLEILAIASQQSEGLAVRALLAAMINLTVSLQRDAEGRLGLNEIAEVTFAEGSALRTEIVLRCSRDTSGTLEATATGHVPAFVEQATSAGFGIDTALFKP